MSEDHQGPGAAASARQVSQKPTAGRAFTLDVPDLLGDLVLEDPGGIAQAAQHNGRLPGELAAGAMPWVSQRPLAILTCERIPLNAAAPLLGEESKALLSKPRVLAQASPRAHD